MGKSLRSGGQEENPVLFRTAVISGVPIVEPLFEVLSASLVVVDGGVATEVLSFGDVKVVWK